MGDLLQAADGLQVAVPLLLGLLELIPHTLQLLFLALQSRGQLRPQLGKPQSSHQRGMPSCNGHLQLAGVLLPTLLEGFLLFLLLLLQRFLQDKSQVWPRPPQRTSHPPEDITPSERCEGLQQGPCVCREETECHVEGCAIHIEAQHLHLHLTLLNKT